jgi:hypothetical protein
VAFLTGLTTRRRTASPARLSDYAASCRRVKQPPFFSLPFQAKLVIALNTWR